jgi:hypothetical protein
VENLTLDAHNPILVCVLFVNVCFGQTNTFKVIWSLGAGLNTNYDGPFATSCVHANGYFATWIAFFSSLTFCYSMILGPSYPVYDVQDPPVSPCVIYIQHILFLPVFLLNMR